MSNPESRPAAARPPLQSPDAMKDEEEQQQSGLSHTFGQLTLASQRGSSRSSTGSSSSSSKSTKLNTTIIRPPSSRHASPSRSPSRSRGVDANSAANTTTTGSHTITSSAGGNRAATPPLLRKASMNSLHSASGAGHPRSLSRRSSHGQMASSPGTPASQTTIHYVERVGPSAASIAKAYFQAELEAHHAPVSTLKTETVVILDDAVYGHRFSRPRTSKAALASIVERPERIKAGLLGVSLAYVRLGERHSDGAFPVHPRRNMETLPSIPFRIHKSSRRLSLSSPAVTNVHGAKWMEELKLMCDSAESILSAGGRELQRQHENEESLLHEGDLYLCSESLSAIEGSLGAVCEAVDTVFSAGPRRAFVAIRPPGHHCSASQPSGFCWVNNVHVGIMHAALTHDLTHAAIIDFDLHHGDGSQAIAWAHNARAASAHKNHAAWKRTSIGYFSLHDINSYPCEAGDAAKIAAASVCIEGAHGQTVWNVHLAAWETESDFWRLYQTKYMVLLDKTRQYLRDQAGRLKAAKREPRAAIFLSAGFDASEWEGAGMQRHKANVPTEFYARLTQDVIQLAAEEGLHVEGRIVSVLEGGYSDRALYSGILSHLSGLAGNQFAENSGDMNSTSDNDNDNEKNTRNNLASIYPYDASWWAAAELDRLDVVAAEPPEPPPKMLRISSSPAPAYSSPTQSSQAKVVDPLKAKRSFSGLSSNMNNANMNSANGNAGQQQQRPPSPAVPEISWMVAARELSRLLIPADRQTDSCTPEELKHVHVHADAEASRRRQSIVEGVDAMSISERERERERPGSRMLLRDRRSRGIIDPISEEGGGGVVVAKNRRKPSFSNAEQGTVSDLPLRRTSRRLSAATQKPTEAEISGSRPTTSSGSRPVSRGNMNMNTASSRPAAIATGLANTRKPRASISDQNLKTLSPRTPRIADVSPPPPSSAKSEAGKSEAGAGKSEPGKDDVSSITTGMRKIRINLITQAQKEARERALADTNTINTNTTNSSSISSNTDIEPPSSPVLSSSIGGHPSSPPTVPALTTTSESGLSTPVLEHYPGAGSPEVKIKQGGTPYVEDADLFVAYQPDGPVPVPVAMGQQEPLKWMPPSVPVPVPAPLTAPVTGDATATDGPATAASTMKGGSPGKGRRGSGIPFATRKVSPRQGKP